MEVGLEGPARQQAVLQGLKLLNMALEYDVAAAEQLSALSVRERVAPLQGLLAASPRRLAVLLQYVLYADTDIQLEVSMAGQLPLFWMYVSLVEVIDAPRWMSRSKEEPVIMGILQNMPCATADCVHCLNPAAAASMNLRSCSSHCWQTDSKGFLVSCVLRKRHLYFAATYLCCCTPALFLVFCLTITGSQAASAACLAPAQPGAAASAKL